MIEPDTRELNLLEIILLKIMRLNRLTFGYGQCYTSQLLNVGVGGLCIKSRTLEESALSDAVNQESANFP